MGADFIDTVEPSATSAPTWRPGTRLRGQLLMGAWALLLYAGLEVGGSALELAQGGALASSTRVAFALSALVPLITVLRAYLGVGQEADSDGLKKSSLGYFGCLGLLALFGIADAVPPPWTVVLAIVIAAGLVGLFLVPFLSAHRPAEKGGALAGLAVAFFVLVKIGLRFVPKLGRKANWNIDFETVIWVEGLILTLCFLGFGIWFAVCKIRLSRTLGGVAPVVGWLEILMHVAFVGAIAWFFVDVIAAAGKPGIQDEDVEKLVAEWETMLTFLAMAITVIWSALTAWLFVSVRNLGQPDWQEQLEPTWSDSNAS